MEQLRKFPTPLKRTFGIGTFEEITDPFFDVKGFLERWTLRGSWKDVPAHEGNVHKAGAVGQGPKRPRQEDRLAQQAVPRSLSPTINIMSPFICGVQDSMTSWMSNLINQQDGCLRIVARQASHGRLRQEQLAQSVANSAPMTSTTSDQAQYLRAQLAYRDAQLEHVRSERDTQFVQEEELPAHMRLLSGETKDWKSRVSARQNKLHIKNP